MAVLASQIQPEPQRWAQWLLFVAVAWGVAAFYSGGGWNQNARFAQVRAMAEEGQFWVDDFLVYRRESLSSAGFVMKRLPIRDAALKISSGNLTGPPFLTVRLAWRDPARELVPIRTEQPGKAGPPQRVVALESVAASGDVSFSKGHFYPNKPPGTSWLALPPYAALLAVERAAGWNPDDWRVLTFNAWMVTVCSVGLVSGLGAVILFRLARRLTDARAALGVALAYAFGTMAFPFGTMLFDHNVTATALIASFALLWDARRKAKAGETGQNDEAGTRRAGLARLTGSAAFAAWGAGLCAGAAVACNYLAGPVLLLLAIYGGRRLRVLGPFLAGAAGPVAVLAFYQAVCFGSPWALCTTGENPLLMGQFAPETRPFFGMFGVPTLGKALALAGSPFRGLFFTSPVLLLAAWGLFGGLFNGRFWEVRSGHQKEGGAIARREAWLLSGVFVFFFGVNVLFCGWHGGYGVAPRYLAPGIPFLALGLAGVWRRHPRLCTAAAGLSVAIQLAFTATDPLSPVGTGSIARVSRRPDWLYSPLTDYALPLFVTGQAGPVLNALREEAMERWRRSGHPERSQLEWLEREMKRAIAAGEVYPFPLAAFRGPVSVNPMGICEGDYFQIFEPGSLQARWNALNIGEFLFPGSRWSLAPILGVVSILLMGAAQSARDAKKKAAAYAGLSCSGSSSRLRRTWRPLRVAPKRRRAPNAPAINPQADGSGTAV